MTLAANTAPAPPGPLPPRTDPRAEPDRRPPRPGRARVEPAGRGVPPPHAPPPLQGAAHRRGDGGDQVEVGRLPRPGGVEVDDVDPPGPARFVLLGHLDGIRGVDRLGLEVALEEADGLAGPQVDSGQELYSHLIAASFATAQAAT